MKIEYTLYYFDEPKIISEDLYKNIKNELIINSKYKFVEKTKSYFKEFKFKFQLLGIISILASILFLIDSKPNSLLYGIKIGIGIALFLGYLFTLFESMTYFEFLYKRLIYYKRMKKYILKSFDYNDFVISFYHKKK